MTILGKLICAMTGKHKRAKRISVNTIDGFASYQCRRCGAAWLRKVKA